MSCLPTFAANVTAEEASSSSTQTVYYVKGGATGDGSSEDNPAGTLSALVAKLTADGNNIKGKEIIVKVISNGSTYVYYNTENNAKSTTPYEATLVFESMDSENQSVLGVTSSSVTSRADQHLRISGPTKFKNIGIYFNRGYSDWMETYCGGYDVTFENVQLYGTGLKIPTTDNGNRIIVQGSVDGLVDGEGGTVIVDTATMTKSNIGYAAASSGVGSSYSDQLTMENDVKLVLGAKSMANEVRIGGAASGSSIAYKKNLNIVLNGTQVPLLYSRNYISDMTEGHALQIIYNDGATIKSETTGTYAFTHLTRYDIHVENVEGAALDTTETAGTYKVTFPEGMKYAIAEDAQGTQYVSEGNLLTVGDAGVYNVTFAKRIKGEPYYVKGGATGDGSSEDNPAGTISALIAKITEDGYVEGEEVVVKVIDNGSTYFHFNYENGNYVIPSHKATLAFESYDEEAPSFLSITPRV